MAQYNQNLLQQMIFGDTNRNRTPIDPQQFRQFAITLNDATLANLAKQARAQGISEQDIQQGINFIKSL